MVMGNMRFVPAMGGWVDLDYLEPVHKLVAGNRYRVRPRETTTRSLWGLEGTLEVRDGVSRLYFDVPPRAGFDSIRVNKEDLA